MKNASRMNLLLGVSAGLLMAGPAAAQLRATYPLSPALTAYPAATVQPPEDSATEPAPSEAVQKLIREKLYASLPAWDKSVITGYQTPTPWEDNLNYSYLNTLLRETPFEWEGKTTPPPDADRLVDKSKSMRIRRTEGAFSYHSQTRVFSPDLKGKAVPSADRVSAQLGEVLKNLAFPMAEGGKPNVQVQEVAVGDDEGKVTERFPSYAFFSLKREIGGIPVEGSTVRAAVNARGEIQRLKIAWPHFRVREGAALLSRDRVIEEAAQKMFSQSPTERLQLGARLVYARSDKGDYLPAVQVDVTDGETPYRLTLPVAR